MVEENENLVEREESAVKSCKNCGTELAEHDSYCPNCGAEVVEERLTLPYLLTKLWQALTDWDSAFVRTLRQLTVKPGIVIQAYNTGVRKRFSNPWKYMLISLTILGLYLYINPFPTFGEMDLKNSLETGYELGGGELEKDEEAQEQLEDFENMDSQMQKLLTNPNYYNFTFFLLIPIYTLITFLLFRKYRYNYAEHLVLNAYLNAHYNYYVLVFGVICWTTSLGGGWFYMGTLVLYYLYLPQVFMTTFDISIGKSIGKALLHLLLFVVTFIVIIIVMGIAAAATVAMFF